jgi:Ca2+-binding EF-hand superfamily protein
VSPRLAPLALAAAFALALPAATARAQVPAKAPQAAARPAAPAVKAPPVGAAIDAAFKAWDSDHDGALSLAEFRAGMDALRRRTEEKATVARLREQFDKIDANHDGGLDASEYASLLLVRDAGRNAPELSAFDRNDDRRLQFAEYLALVARLAPAQQQPARKTP